MRIADSHEFLELYRGDKDLRMGIEMLKLRDDLEFASFAPDRLSPSDRDLCNATSLAEVSLPKIPDRMELKLLPSRSVRFARREGGGVVSFMPAYGRELRRWKPDVILENPFSWLTPRSYQTHRVSRALDVPVVYYDPGDAVPITRQHRIMALWESRVVSNASVIITFTPAGVERFVDKYGYPEDRIVVIEKPVDVGRFCEAEQYREQTRVSLGLSDSQLAVGYLGRLTNAKGCRSLLEVAKNASVDPSLRAARFVFVGDTLSSTETRSDYELTNTCVTGMIPNSEIPSILAALDVVVFPDITKPGGFPTAVAETMAAGKAIVLGVEPDAQLMPLVHRQSALLVTPSSPDEIASSLREMMADRDILKRLGDGARDVTRRRMDYPVVAARWLQIIEGL